MQKNGERGVRLRAFLHVIVSGAVAVILVALLLMRGEVGGRRGILLVTALPCAWFLVQMAALVTGVPFVTMAKKWDSLAAAHRFLFGVTILAVAFLVFGGVGLAVAMSLSAP